MITLNWWNWVLPSAAIVDIFAFFVMVSIIWRLNLRQKLAYKGDVNAARHLVLPCFKPIFFAVSVLLFFTCIIFLLLSLFISEKVVILQVLQMKLLLTCGVYSVPPVLFTQKTISLTSAKRVFLIISPWFLFSTCIWFASFFPGDVVDFLLKIMFTILASCPFSFCCIIYTKIIWARITFASASNRSCLSHLLVFSVIYLLFNICLLITSKSDFVNVLLAHSIALARSIITMFSAGRNYEEHIVVRAIDRVTEIDRL